jgi:hypothetical protein
MRTVGRNTYLGSLKQRQLYLVCRQCGALPPATDPAGHNNPGDSTNYFFGAPTYNIGTENV